MTHRDDALEARDGDEREVALRPSGGGVDDDVDRLLPLDLRRAHGHDGVDVRRAEALLQRVERHSLSSRRRGVTALVIKKKE